MAVNGLVLNEQAVLTEVGINTAILVMSLINFGVGLWIRIMFSYWPEIDGTGYFVFLSDSFIILSVLIWCLAMYGILATQAYDKDWFDKYLYALLFICFLIVPYCIATFVSADMILKNLDYQLKRVFLEQYDMGVMYEESTQHVDHIQHFMECCGVHNVSDWKDAAYLKYNLTQMTADGGSAVPLSCCIVDDSPECNLGTPGLPTFKEELHPTPCEEVVWRYLRLHLDLFIAISFILMLLVLLALIWGLCYRHSMTTQPSSVKETLVDKLFSLLGYDTKIVDGRKVHTKRKRPIKPRKTRKPAPTPRPRPDHTKRLARTMSAINTNRPVEVRKESVRPRPTNLPDNQVATMFWHIGEKERKV